MPVYRRERLTRSFGPSYNPAASAIIAAMSPAPSVAREELINALVTSLITASVWDKLGVLYVFAAHAAQPALLNWKNPTGTAAVATNSPTFTADRGYTGDGVSAFIDTQIAWNAVPGVSQDNVHIGAYAVFNSAAGTALGTTSAATIRMGRTAGGLATTRLSDGADRNADATSGTAGVHIVASRTLSIGYDRYIDGVAGTAGTTASTGVGTGNLSALRSNAVYGASGTSVRAIHGGSALTAGEVAALFSALQTYMVAVGAS